MNFRLDRLATLYLVSPYLRIMPAREASVPILMYHSIGDEQDSQLHPYYRTTTSPATFASQLRHLHAQGYKTCSLAQAIDQLNRDEPTTDKLVVITFDDGYHDFYRYAFPLLSQYGFSATMFLPTFCIGSTPVSFKGKECLTWSEVRELNRHGTYFGSHTVTHPQLRDLTASAVNGELANSKKAIEDNLGCAVDSFAYPYAFPQADTDFTQMLRDSLRRAGYRNGVCTVIGRANRQSDPLFLERLPINSCDDAALFAAKLAGAYDWISRPQYFAKIAKTRAPRFWLQM